MRPIEKTIVVDGASVGDFIPLDIYNRSQVTTISVNLLSGTANYSVQFTNEDPFNTAITPLPAPHPVATLTGATASQTAFTETLMRAVRLNTASGTGTLRLTITQQSIA